MAKKTTKRAAKRTSPRKAATPKYAGCSDEAVRKATGRGWEAWFKILDRFGVAEKGHGPASDHIHEKHKCPAWWSQMVVVGYEQARGLRAVHQKADGFSGSVSRTLAAPLAAMSRAWIDDGARAKWLTGCDIEVRKATPLKSVRITWNSGGKIAPTKGKVSSVEVNLYPKGDSKSQCAVQHNKLASAADVKRAKAYWSAALDRLAAHLGL